MAFCFSMSTKSIWRLWHVCITKLLFKHFFTWTGRVCVKLTHIAICNAVCAGENDSEKIRANKKNVYFFAQKIEIQKKNVITINHWNYEEWFFSSCISLSLGEWVCKCQLWPFQTNESEQAAKQIYMLHIQTYTHNKIIIQYGMVWVNASARISLCVRDIHLIHKYVCAFLLFVRVNRKHGK